MSITVALDRMLTAQFLCHQDSRHAANIKVSNTAGSVGDWRVRDEEGHCLRMLYLVAL
jgi:hypothetical protein